MHVLRHRLHRWFWILIIIINFIASWIHVFLLFFYWSQIFVFFDDLLFFALFFWQDVFTHIHVYYTIFWLVCSVNIFKCNHFLAIGICGTSSFVLLTIYIWIWDLSEIRRTTILRKLVCEGTFDLILLGIVVFHGIVIYLQLLF